MQGINLVSGISEKVDLSEKTYTTGIELLCYFKASFGNRYDKEETVHTFTQSNIKGRNYLRFEYSNVHHPLKTSNVMRAIRSSLSKGDSNLLIDFTPLLKHGQFLLLH